MLWNKIIPPKSTEFISLHHKFRYLWNFIDTSSVTVLNTLSTECFCFDVDQRNVVQSNISQFVLRSCLGGLDKGDHLTPGFRVLFSIYRPVSRRKSNLIGNSRSTLTAGVSNSVFRLHTCQTFLQLSQVIVAQYKHCHISQASLCDYDGIPWRHWQGVIDCMHRFECTKDRKQHE